MCYERKKSNCACLVGSLLTFFSAGSWTVSASLLRAFRICEAATLVDVFSKAYNASNISGMFSMVLLGLLKLAAVVGALTMVGKGRLELL
jgi:hypothetical protein